MLPAGFSIEVRAACLPRFHFPGLQQGRLPIPSHLDDEICQARNRKFLYVGLGRIWNVDPEYGSEGRDHDAMTFLIDMNDWAIETFFLGKARGCYQAEEEEAGEDGAKSRTHV